MEISTSKGKVRLPAYLPVTTWGTEYPLDDLIRPFLPRYADMLMVSYAYAVGISEAVKLPLFINAGGFSLLLDGAELIEREDGLGEIVRVVEDRTERVDPVSVLRLQEAKAQWGSTLDFPIPMGCAPAEAQRRLRLTLANACWARQNGLGTLRLFGSVQGWDLGSYKTCAKELLAMGYEDLAIGGLVPRANQKDFLVEVTRGVRGLMGSGLLHLFGMGEPEMVRTLFEAGASSVDSTSYVRAAASGKRWDGGWAVDVPSGLERAHMAIANLRYATRVSCGGQAELANQIDEEAEF